MPTLFYRDPVDGEFKPVVGGGNDHGGLAGLLDDDHPQYQLLSQKGQASGYAPLDATSKIAAVYLPSELRRIFASTGAPSGGVDGDVWMTYT
jgi:hypothetical protein